MLTKPFLLNRKLKPASSVYRPSMLPIAFDDDEAMEAPCKPAPIAGRIVKRKVVCTA